MKTSHVLEQPASQCKRVWPRLKIACAPGLISIGLPGPLKVHSAADKTMADRGWDRVVGVMNPREMVAVYLAANARSPRNVKVCVVALNGKELVVASARSNLEALMEMAGILADRHHVDLSPLRLS